MLTQICQYLHNWFNRKPDGTMYPIYNGTFTIANGALEDVELAEGQYFRIIGSLFNDGVHCTTDTLTNETFSGTIWAMGIPPAVVQLATEISDWQAQYGGTDSPAMSPYQSESFAGYSYSKGNSNSSASSDAGDTGWQAAYATRLAPWRKI